MPGRGNQDKRQYAPTGEDRVLSEPRVGYRRTNQKSGIQKNERQSVGRWRKKDQRRDNKRREKWEKHRRNRDHNSRNISEQSHRQQSDSSHQEMNVEEDWLISEKSTQLGMVGFEAQSQAARQLEWNTYGGWNSNESLIQDLEIVNNTPVTTTNKERPK